MGEINQEKELPNNINELTIEDDTKSETATEICSTLDEFQRSCSCCASEMIGGSCCSLIVDKLLAKLKLAEEERAVLVKNEQVLD